MTVYNPFDFFVEESAEIWPFEYGEDLRPDLVIYRTPEPAGPRLAGVSATGSTGRPSARSISWSISTAAFRARSNIVIRMEPGVQSPEETFERASGSCRDSSWLLVQILRNLGLAARFVSGYLIQLKPDLVALDGPPGTDHDFTDLHAWAEVYLPGAGWIGLDPTSGLLTGESHIPLAATPHYRNAAPISGLASFANVDFKFDMRVERVAEHPRITKPYSEEAWKALDALGEEVDRKLVADDVRLTMGGEPTFVSIDDFESGEWNTDAVGPTKRALADRLIRRLRDRFAPGGFLHYGQGKWYPGESLPRWTFSLYWRRDGKPIWSNPKRIAVEGEETGASNEKAQALLGAIASELGVASDYVAPAYEDPAEWIVKEANLPRERLAGELQTQGPRGAPPDRPRFLARPDRAFRIRAAGPALAGEGRRAALAQRKMEDAPRRAPSGSRRQSGRLPPAARARCPTFRPRPSPISSRPIRPSRAGRCRISMAPGSAPSGSPRSPRRRRASRSGSSSGSATSTAPFAPR